MGRKEKLQIEIEVPSKALSVQNAHCPNGHLLRDESVQIHGHPSIKVKVRNRGQEGFLYIDPIYGSYDNQEKDVVIKKDDVVELFCPECGLSLKEPSDTCQLCSSPMFVFHLPNGGIVEGCLKKGCMFHRMKIIDAEKQLGRSFENNTLESFL